MNKEEKEQLKNLVESEEGLLSVGVFTSGINKRKIAQKLIARRLVEECQYKNMPHYRATEKGLMIFESTLKKIWYFIKGDVRTIIVAIITSLIITIITLILFK